MPISPSDSRVSAQDASFTGIGSGNMWMILGSSNNLPTAVEPAWWMCLQMSIRCSIPSIIGLSVLWVAGLCYTLIARITLFAAPLLIFFNLYLNLCSCLTGPSAVNSHTFQALVYSLLGFCVSGALCGVILVHLMLRSTTPRGNNRGR